MLTLSSRLAVIAGAIAFGSLAYAEDLYDGAGINSFRLEVSQGPKAIDWSSDLGSGGSVVIDGEEDADRAYRVALAASRRTNNPFSFVVGGAVAYTHLEEDRSGDDDRFQSLTVDARIGAAIALGRMFHVEATPFVGAGAGRGDLGGQESDVGFVWEYGIQGGVFLTVNKFQFGVVGGWVHSEWELDFDNGGSIGPDSIGLELTQEGPFIGLSIGGVM